MRGAPPTPATSRLVVPSPVGDLLLLGDDEALTGIRFPGGRPDPDGAPPPAGTSPSRVLQAAAAQLGEYFGGRRIRFDLPLRPAGTAFQMQVWALLAEVPYGSTWSYGELAARLGRPTAVRAVGAANGRNPLPIVLPCHRIVGSDGSLTGFGGGLPAKRLLLDLEVSHRPAAADTLF